MRPKLKPLAEQVIVITGASSGIGLATAMEAARKGAKVVLSSRNDAALAEAEQAIRSEGGEAIHVVADVAKRDDIKALAEAAIAAYGGFDTWVNNAGLSIFGKLEEISDDDHRQVFDINFWGLVNGSLIAARHFKTAGGGAIINLGSLGSDVSLPVQGIYSASKHAVKGFTEAFRMELLSEDAPISLTLIKPASIDTPFPRHAKSYLQAEPKLPPPVYKPEEVASVILHAAVYGGRDYYVGGGSKLLSSFNKHFPAAVDWMGARFMEPQSSRGVGPERDRAGALHAAGQDGDIHGDSRHMVRNSLYNRATEHPMLAGAALTMMGLSAIRLLLRKA